MELGRWKENGETIKRSGSNLIDGQHRLLACVSSKTPFHTLIVDGLTDDIFDSIDANVSRSASDTLSVLGEKNTQRLASALSFVHRYMAGSLEKNRGKVSNFDVQELLARYPSMRSSVSHAGFVTGLVPFTTVAGLHYLFSRKDETLALRFMHQLIKGQDLREGSPVYVLRERLVQNSMAKAKLTNPYIAAIIIKTWNYTRAGSRVKYLRFRERGESRETFPLIT